MSVDKRSWQGSERRDIFKRLHKQLNGSFYGCDLDFTLVSKYPPGIVAFLDYKTPWDMVQFSEVLAYNDLMDKAPVYIIEASNPQTGPFTIRQYKGGDWRPNPPKVQLQTVAVCSDWEALGRWERDLRMRYNKMAFAPNRNPLVNLVAEAS